jgi:hypothetical protein
MISIKLVAFSHLELVSLKPDHTQPSNAKRSTGGSVNERHWKKVGQWEAGAEANKELVVRRD